jgi:hypothetical protein
MQCPSGSKHCSTITGRCKWAFGPFTHTNRDAVVTLLNVRYPAQDGWAIRNVAKIEFRSELGNSMICFNSAVLANCRISYCSRLQFAPKRFAHCGPRQCFPGHHRSTDSPRKCSRPPNLWMESEVKHWYSKDACLS